ARLVGNLAEVRGERLGLEIEIHENKLAPGFTAQRHHAHGTAIEEFDAIHVRSVNQAAIERVGPTVILAAQNILAAATECKGSGAMTANVAEGAQLTLLVANDDDRLAHNIHGEETFRVGNRVLGSVHVAAALMESA